jgi:Eco57I restriction-modification methylase
LDTARIVGADERERARGRVHDLVERYRSLLTSGRIRTYNEAHTVQDFILPLFEALGWDIHNRDSRDEVLPESPAASGRADWAFNLNGITKVLVEAKSLPSNLANPEFARQAINYSYSRGVTWAVLTNFAELHVYNAEWALPDPQLLRFLSFSWGEYERDFDRLWLLSKPAFESGQLDVEAERYGKKRLKTPVGEQLFGDLVEFRNDLRSMVVAFHPEVPVPVADHAVQRLLDRLIFMRAAEDREIEPIQLMPLLRRLEHTRKRDTLWSQLLSLFREWEGRYDSQLFADQPLDHLDPLWEPVWRTIKGLYESDGGLIQYDFRGIDADVLGGVYEQYLGHLAKSEAAPISKRRRHTPAAPKEVTRPFRKAHGVYYTPRWMVRFIVAEALAPILEKRSPDEIRSIRILDPACGSGSFLVEAFNVLSRYWAREEAPASAEASLAMRLRILRDNLFGIDLDPQAVEIAQLNLLLAALTQPTLLPDLSTNFAIGNALFDRRLRPVPSGFDTAGWFQAAFLGAGGADHQFDVVVMNPPYYDLQGHPYQQEALRSVYPEVASGHDDILYFFLARALDLLRADGQLGCVVARYWLDSKYAQKLRALLASRLTVRQVVDFQSYQPFGREVGVNAAILIATAGRSAGPTRYLMPSTDGFGELPRTLLESVSGLRPSAPEFSEIEFSTTEAPWRPRPQGRRRPRVSRPLGTIAFLSQGVKAGRNEVFVVGPRLIEARNLEMDFMRPVLEGEDIGAFALRETGRRLIYLDGSVPVAAAPNIGAYLAEHEDELRKRAEASNNSYPWWRLQRPRRGPAVDAPVRLLAPQLATRPRFSVVTSSGPIANAVGLTDTVMLALVDQGVSPYFLLGVLNSQYAAAWARENTKTKRGGYREFGATAMAGFPVPELDPNSTELIADLARELQVYLDARIPTLSKGRFDDLVNGSQERQALLAEIDRLLDQ